MHRDRPHRLAFFSLVPINDRAWKVLKLPENAHLISRFQDNHDSKEILYGLDVGLHIGSKSRYTLATIGRTGDITVEGTGISRIHCSFEIPEGNQEEIMLQDRSSNKSTRFVGETAMSFEENRPHRQVIVDKNVNLELEFGTSSDLHQFRLVWHNREGLVSEIEDREDNPRKTRTLLDQPPTAQPSRPVTRIHTASGNLGMIRYSKRDKLGSGSFGEVWKAANIDSGEYLAVKRVQLPSLMSHDYLLLKREVELLARISHKNIIEYIAGQKAEEYFDIIMELKLGSVQHLIRDDLYIREPTLANRLLQQMLQALDYLASKDIIHRDVKPENILYTPLPDGEYLYQLADFGLANIAADARTFAGSRIFMAPELDNGPQSPQTPEMDVWSLFVTLTYAMNVASFREKPLQTTPLRIKAIQEAADEPVFRSLRDMAVVDPKQRATAGDMLDRLFGGEGRAAGRKQMRATVMVIDETQPGPSEPQIEAEKVIHTEERLREPAETAEEWPPREAAIAGRRPRLVWRANEKQRAGPAVEATALGPLDQKHGRVMKQDAPRLHSATRARQRRYFT